VVGVRAEVDDGRRSGERPELDRAAAEPAIVVGRVECRHVVERVGGEAREEGAALVRQVVDGTFQEGFLIEKVCFKRLLVKRKQCCEIEIIIIRNEII
jgi:hypothetical protein